jgi:hypothetical protein
MAGFHQEIPRKRSAKLKTHQKHHLLFGRTQDCLLRFEVGYSIKIKNVNDDT